MKSTAAGKLRAVTDTLKQQETNNVHQVDPRGGALNHLNSVKNVPKEPTTQQT